MQVSELHEYPVIPSVLSLAPRPLSPLRSCTTRCDQPTLEPLSAGMHSLFCHTPAACEAASRSGLLALALQVILLAPVSCSGIEVSIGSETRSVDTARLSQHSSIHCDSICCTSAMNALRCWRVIRRLYEQNQFASASARFALRNTRDMTSLLRQPCRASTSLRTLLLTLCPILPS